MPRAGFESHGEVISVTGSLVQRALHAVYYKIDFLLVIYVRVVLKWRMQPSYVVKFDI